MGVIEQRVISYIGLTMSATDSLPHSEVKQLLGSQQAYFRSGATRELSFRKKQLKRLRQMLSENREACEAALFQDLHKSAEEAFLTEIGFLIREINHAIKHVEDWAAPKSVPGSVLNFPSRSQILQQPYGNALIISPWNYPLMLALSPVVGAIAAGNTVVMKPSELAPHTSQLLANLAPRYFESEFLAVVTGGVSATQALLQEPWDYVFFPGSTRVGKIVMKAAAEHLTPVTLELGGKSPCIIDETAVISAAAKRVMYGKFVNCGQTCIAPDYVVIHESKYEAFVSQAKQAIQQFFGNDARKSADFGRIIHEDHWNRLVNYLSDGEVLAGGAHDVSDRYIEPTLLHVEDTGKPVMQEEIFGPILPILTYTTEEELQQILDQNPNPLALYLFSRNTSFRKRILTNTSFGGGMVNDTLEYLVNGALPFGGIGQSGMGGYHGQHSFQTFSHAKSVMHKPARFEIPLKYPPLKRKGKLLRALFRIG